MKQIIFFLVLLSANVFSQIAPEWAYTYPGTSNGINKILKDNTGNFLFLSRTNLDTNNVSGGFILLGKVNSSGILLWKRIYSKPGIDSGDHPVSMVLDNQNNILILNHSHGYTTGIDMSILKYDQNGNLLWDYFYTTPGGINSHDQPNALTVDAQGNCILTGFTTSGFYIDSITTIKLSSAGSLQWVKKFAQYSIRLNSGECIISDNQNNVYVGGAINDTSNGFLNAVLIKYNSSGVLQWTRSYNGISNNTDCFLDLKMDSQGNIVASGAADDIYNYDSASVLLTKYTSGGNLIWSQVFHTIAPFGEIGKKILMDNSDNIYIMGQTHIYPYSYYSNTFILKYNSFGNLLWNKLHGNYYSTTSFPYDISFDNSQNILISGFENRYGRTNLMLLKYDKNDGTLLWNYLYNHTGSSNDIALFSTYTGNNFFVAGSSSSKFLLMKMQPTNAFTYTFRRDNLFKPIIDSQYTYDTVMLNSDELPPAAYIKSIHVTIDTIMHGAMGDIEIYLMNGNLTDTLFYRRGGPLDNMIGTKLNDTSALNICSNGLPPFTGYFAPCRSFSKHLFLPGNGPWILKIYDRKAPDTGYLKSWSLTLRYETIIGINPVSNEVPHSYTLSQNYPNPFNPVTKIRYSIPESANIRITVYDINGKEIKTLVNQWLNTGIYESDFDGSNMASGVYFYSLTASNYTATKKMVLIK